MNLHVSSTIRKIDGNYENYGLRLTIGSKKIDLKGKLFFRLGEYLYKNYSLQLNRLGDKISLLKDSLFIKPISEESWEEIDTKSTSTGRGNGKLPTATKRKK